MYYIIGLIITDGNVSKDGRKLTLSLTDENIITLLSKHMIDLNKRKIYQQKPKGKNSSKSYSLINTNVSTINKLKELGIIENKTYYQQYPSIPDDYVYDFIRGIFDGDGCVYISNKSYDQYFSISITSASEAFTNGFVEQLKQLGYSPRAVLDSRRRYSEHKTYYIKLNKQEEIKTFMFNIYKNAKKYKINYKYDKYYNKNIV